LLQKETYESLKKGQRVLIDTSSIMGGRREREFEVGRTSLSRKYDVYTKALYPVEGGVPVTRGRAKWKLFLRNKSGRVSLAHGDMGMGMESFIIL